jgi:hypothetical protein
VDSTDKLIVQLADPTTRAAVFDDQALQSLVQAGYTVDSVSGPFSPVFDEVRLGFPVPPTATVQGTWAPIGDPKPTELRLSIAGLAGDGPVVVAALWRGGVVARFAPAGDAITDVAERWPDLAEIDRMVVAALGALPAEPQLEAARRAQLRVLARKGLAGPDPLSAADVDEWLARGGVSSVAELLARPDIRPFGLVRVTFAAPKPALDTPRLIPLTVALLVPGQAISVASLLADTYRVRERLALAGVEPSAHPALPVRVPVVVAWVVPVTVFDDDGWPGATSVMNADQRRAARRAAATAWLAQQGVGLVAVPS